MPDVLASLDREYTSRYSAALGEDEVRSGRASELLIIDRTYCHDAAIAVMLRLHSALTNYVLFAEYVWMTRVLPLLDVARHQGDRHASMCFRARRTRSSSTGSVISGSSPKRKRGESRWPIWSSPFKATSARLSSGWRRTVQLSQPASISICVGEPELPRDRIVLYVGSGNPMNVHGLREFLKFAWPSIREQIPDAVLRVAGAVGEALDHCPPGVEVLGRVADLDGFYRTARVVINPALAGTGVKIKTVEALSHLRPVVTWPTGVEGLPHELTNLCDVVRDWFEFSSRVVSRLADRSQRSLFSGGAAGSGACHIAAAGIWRPYREHPRVVEA